VQRRDHSVAAFFHSDAVAAGSTVTLGDDALHHALVRRAEAGERVRLLSGTGSVALGQISQITKKQLTVSVETVEQVAKPTPLEIFVPVADRDRMLWAAEKCVEHQVTAWRPVMYARSRSVSSRGEGPKFAAKVEARMRSALEQSGGAWLPEMHTEAEPDHAFSADRNGEVRIVLDASGEPFSALRLSGPMAVAVGPEGGFEANELAAARDRGWRVASLGNTVLRFETAVISAVAVIRAAQLSQRS
jgi:16S rRNA (uracil1498-N3)-methyltransferase